MVDSYTIGKKNQKSPQLLSYSNNNQKEINCSFIWRGTDFTPPWTPSTPRIHELLNHIQLLCKES